MSYSQLAQDLTVINFFKKFNGYFIEIGAIDGIELSNTYLLEKKYNWKGICVEPIPQKFDMLCKNRPNSLCSNKAVFSESNKTVIFDIANDAEFLSGISDCIDCHAAAVNANKTQIVVETITLNDLLKQFNAPPFIEYMSLDTEGSELEILKAVDFQKYTFGIIDVEHNFVEPRRTQIRELLTSKNYVFVKENQWDDHYIHKSLHMN